MPNYTDDHLAPYPSTMTDVGLAYAIAIERTEPDPDIGWLDQAEAEAKHRGLVLR